MTGRSDILRDKANYDVLEGFLSTLQGKDIRDLALLESESNQEDESDKFNRVDLSVENETGEMYVIEVQAGWERYYLQRLLYGSSELMVDRMRLGDSFAKVKKVISVSILYFLFSKIPRSDRIFSRRTFTFRRRPGNLIC